MVYTNFNKKRNRFNNKLKFKSVIIYNEYIIYYILYTFEFVFIFE